jgi:DNA segregation ATPase FtsK/SpoIIIE, S-DNA-T family
MRPARSGPVPTAPPGSLALLVASGPAAGASAALPADGTVIGREAPIWLYDDEVSRRHLSIAVGGGAVTVADAGSANGTVVSGLPLAGERPVQPGELIWAGRTALTVGRAPAADAQLVPAPDGSVRYSRSPRTKKAPKHTRRAVPDPPPEAERSSFPWFAIATPVIAGVLMAIVLKQPEYLAFIALSPVMVIGNTLSDRRHGKRGYRQRLVGYERERDAILAELAACRQAELDYRRHEHPDPATLLLIASAPSRRLWERSPFDDDFLALRVGTGTVPWPSEDPARSGGNSAGGVGGVAADQLPDAPVVLSLAECGAIGITGPVRQARALARGMLMSLSVLHSPHEVSVTLLTGQAGARGAGQAGGQGDADWDWIGWLPHARPPGAREAKIGHDPDTIRLRVAELNAALEARRPGTFHGRSRPGPSRRDVVILDGSRQLRLEPGVAGLLREGAAAGIYFLCLDDSVAGLPPECRRAVMELSDDSGVIVADVHGPGYDILGVVADAVSVPVCEAAARAMAPVREDSPQDTGDAWSAVVRFLDIAGLEPPTPERIRSFWAAGGRSTKALLGRRADGPFVVDLSQGPHLLVAGTTGSGKSELLQTLVASLAVANRPDTMNFVLVDYKGGAAFHGCAPLPHTVGMVTDLNEFEVERALASMRAELQRRKAVLAQAGKSDIGPYWDALPSHPGADPLPRLVIVVDEFAVMAEQLPAQLKALVNIGMQGRSLGIHLVLATQRPSGVVTADLRANINLRIALRVASAEDSRDVIETADAAKIPVENTAGRGYAWLGGGRPAAFQAALVTGPRPDRAYPSDLNALVAAINAAAQQEHIDRRPSPWRQPLPDGLALDRVPEWLGARGRPPSPRAEQLVFGVIDQPAVQMQIPAVLDIAGGGHLLVAGAPQSGRTSLLRTLAASLITQVHADDAHLYVFDGGGGLAALSMLPHCGAVVTPGETDRADRLLAGLTGELTRRTRLLSAGGYGDLAEYRQANRAADRVPFLLVFVDRYDAFVSTLEQIDHGRLVEQFQRLMRDGLGAGIRVVATGDRSLLTGKMASLAEDKIVLRMADRADYGLVGLNARSVPAVLPAGRGFRLPASDLLQVALVSQDAQGAAQNRELRARAERAARPSIRPFRVDPLPVAISFEDACELPAGPGSGAVGVGVGGDDLSRVRVDTPGLLVIGPPGSGRSTALAVQARWLAGAGVPLIVVAPRASALSSALAPVSLRLHLTGTGSEAATALEAALSEAARAVMVIDDAELLHGTPLGDQITARCRGLRDSGYRVLAATVPESLTPMRGIPAELAKLKCGLVLEPANVLDGQPFGVRLPSSILAAGIPLRAALVHGSRITAVQVPSITNRVAEPEWSGSN